MSLDSVIARSASNHARLLAVAVPILEAQVHEEHDPTKWEALCFAIGSLRVGLETSRQQIARGCAPWFEPVQPGRYAVQSIGEAGISRDEFTGFHYPYPALAKVEELEARKGNRREVFFAVNTDDAEASVEAEDEDYAADFPRLCRVLTA